MRNARSKKISVGRNLQLYCKLSIKGPGQVAIGRDCSISGIPGARVNMVTFYTHSPEAVITIGNNVKLISARISSRFAIEIGNDVVIEDVSILDSDFHTLDISRRTPPDETIENCKVIIEDDVRIGSRAIIGKGVTIGRGSLVHPGSVVQKSFPEYSEILGNPAKPIRKMESPQRR
jgi:acetyltransferase-like isoleucine patch superfamily enzyme